MTSPAASVDAPDPRARAGRTYHQFLAAKAQLAPATGLEIDPGEVHPVLKPHQREVARADA